MSKLLSILLVVVAAVGCDDCADDAAPAPIDAPPIDGPSIPTCAELGAPPNAPLFCYSLHLCLYNGQKCTVP